MGAKGQPKTPGSGRKKGSTDLRARYLTAAAARAGLTPKDYLLGVLRDPQASIERRDWAAATLAPYVMPKLAAIETKVEQYSQLEMRVTRAELAAEAKRRIDEAFREYQPPKTIDHVPPPQQPEPERPPREYAREGPLAAAPGVSRLPMRIRPPRPVGDWSG